MDAIGEPAALDLIHDLYDYHWWANRRLFDVAAGLGPEMATREMGGHWSFPTLKGMFAHVYGADRSWLGRWKDGGWTPPAGDRDFENMATLRAAWDALESEQRAFIAGLTPAELARVLEYRRGEGPVVRVPLRSLLQHVPNHATHHRSEIAAMLTLLSGSPPDTGFHTFHLWHTGQQR